MNGEDLNEKKQKAGNPIFIIIIFAALLGFLFFIPEIYKRYNTEISNFLGVGKDKEDSSSSKEKYIEPMSSYFDISSTGTLKYNEIVLSNVSLKDNILFFTISSEDKVDLEKLDYYMEFYQNKKVYLGRRALKGIVDKSLDIELDVSNLNINSGTYLAISHIDAIPPYEGETDESGLSLITCKKNNYTYEYEFNLKELHKVVRKYSYSSNDMEEYASELLKAEKEKSTYDELTGVSASIVEDGYSFMMITEFDYSKIETFRVDDPYLYKKGTFNNIIRFKMDAEGFECE